MFSKSKPLNQNGDVLICLMYSKSILIVGVLFSADIDVIVIDLRNNGGGVLQSAVDVANLLLPPGKIVTFVVGKDGLQDAMQTLQNGIASSDPKLPDLKTKLLILVNEQTASAAEVLTAGLKVKPVTMLYFIGFPPSRAHLDEI